MAGMNKRHNRNYTYEETPEIKEEPVVQEPVEDAAETPEAPVKPSNSIPKQCKVNVPRLNLRQKPNTESQILDVLNQDDVLEIIGDMPDFYKVSTSDNEVGYVVKKYVVAV